MKKKPADWNVNKQLNECKQTAAFKHILESSILNSFLTNFKDKNFHKLLDLKIFKKVYNSNSKAPKLLQATALGYKLSQKVKNCLTISQNV